MISLALGPDRMVADSEITTSTVDLGRRAGRVRYSTSVSGLADEPLTGKRTGHSEPLLSMDHTE